MRISNNQMKELLKLYFIMGSQNTTSIPQDVLNKSD